MRLGTPYIYTDASIPFEIITLDGEMARAYNLLIPKMSDC